MQTSKRRRRRGIMVIEISCHRGLNRFPQSKVARSVFAGYRDAVDKH